MVDSVPSANASGSVPVFGVNAYDATNEEIPAVSIRGFVKTFGKKVAVDNLSLDIPAGSFYGLVGPNGAGKTTTIKMLTGLLMPDAGSASIFGNDVWSDVNSAKRSIGLMPQADEIFKTITGLQLLTYAGMLRDMSRAESVKRANDLLSAFDLTEAANTIVSDYSTGMTKKICLATAMIHSPRVLVLDEPFEAVDPVSNANLKDILAEYVSTGGTVIISSHVMELVEKCARTWQSLTKVMLQLLALLKRWLRAKILKIALWSLLADVTLLHASTGLMAVNLIMLLHLPPISTLKKGEP